MRSYTITLTGKMPLLMHNDNIAWSDQMAAWKDSAQNKKTSKAPQPARITLDGLLGNPRRRFCEGLAPTLEREAIERNGRPYLDRYYLAGWQPGRRPGSAVYLHHFLSSDDPGVYHSHPWAWSCSLILVGGYREARCVTGPLTAQGGRISGEGVIVERMYLPGEVNVILAEDRHRIDLLESDAWTLFLAGDYARPWKFGDCEV